MQGERTDSPATGHHPQPEWHTRKVRNATRSAPSRIGRPRREHCGEEYKKGFQPSTTNTSPSKIRTIKIATFISIFSLPEFVVQQEAEQDCPLHTHPFAMVQLTQALWSLARVAVGRSNWSGCAPGPGRHILVFPFQMNRAPPRHCRQHRNQCPTVWSQRVLNMLGLLPQNQA